jgi:hypothetical protein
VSSKEKPAPARNQAGAAAPQKPPLQNSADTLYNQARAAYAKGGCPQATDKLRSLMRADSSYFKKRKKDPLLEKCVNEQQERDRKRRSYEMDAAEQPAAAPSRSTESK